MANWVQRMKLVVNSNIEVIISKFEKPEVMIEGILSESIDNLGKIDVDLTAAKGNLAVAKRKYKELGESVAAWEYTAERALMAGNEADAREALSRQEKEQNLLDAQKIAMDSCAQAVSVLEDSYNEVKGNIEIIRGKRDEIKAKSNAAEAVRSANKVSSKDYSSLMGKFDEMADKVDSKLAGELAMADFRRDTKDSSQDLKKKYSSPSVDNKLEAMKARLGQQ